MKRCLLFNSILLALLTLPNLLLAQVVQPDTSFLRHSLKAAIKSYNDAAGLQSHLYNGPEYYAVAKPYLDGHQFFEEKTLDKGAVFYDGAWFYDVPMLYDLVEDELITYHPGGGFTQKLIKQKIDTFKLKGHTFVHLTTDSTSDSPLKPGFYKLFYSGEVNALARQEKTLQERVSSDGLEGRYDLIEKYYLQKEGTYHPVKSKRSVLKVLSDERKPLQKFARANKLKFKKRREEAILKVAQHYDFLKQ